MFAANLSSHARAVSVLLGGSGVCQPLPRDVSALLLPRLPRTTRKPSGSTYVASVRPLEEVDRHD